MYETFYFSENEIDDEQWDDDEENISDESDDNEKYHF